MTYLFFFFLSATPVCTAWLLRDTQNRPDTNREFDLKITDSGIPGMPFTSLELGDLFSAIGVLGIWLMPKKCPNLELKEKQIALGIYVTCIFGNRMQKQK